MMLSFLKTGIFIAVVCSTLLTIVVAQTECPKVDGDSCICKTKSGKYLDLRNIGNSNETNPNFEAEHRGFRYYLNPCYGVALNVPSGLCNKGDNMVACQQKIEKNDISSWGLGSVDTQIIYETNGSYYVMYTDGQIEGNTKRITKINLICDATLEDSKMTTEGDDKTSLEYVFTITSKEVCLEDKVAGVGGGTIAGPIGIAVIFLAIAILITYFVAGIIINKFVLHKTGTDVVPQKTFWFVLPGLLKDGVLFTFSPLIRLCRKDYEPLIGSVQNKKAMQ